MNKKLEKMLASKKQKDNAENTTVSVDNLLDLSVQSRINIFVEKERLKSETSELDEIMSVSPTDYAQQFSQTFKEGKFTSTPSGSSSGSPSGSAPAPKPAPSPGAQTEDKPEPEKSPELVPEKPPKEVDPRDTVGLTDAPEAAEPRTEVDPRDTVGLTDTKTTPKPNLVPLVEPPTPAAPPQEPEASTLDPGRISKFSGPKGKFSILDKQKTRGLPDAAPTTPVIPPAPPTPVPPPVPPPVTPSATPVAPSTPNQKGKPLFESRIPEKPRGEEEASPLNPKRVEAIVLHDISAPDRVVKQIESLPPEKREEAAFKAIPIGAGEGHYHVIFDSKGVYQSIPFDRQAPHAAEFNEKSIGISFRGIEGTKISENSARNGAVALSMIYQHMKQSRPDLTFDAFKAMIKTHPELSKEGTRTSGKNPKEGTWKNAVLNYLETPSGKKLLDMSIDDLKKVTNKSFAVPRKVYGGEIDATVDNLRNDSADIQEPIYEQNVSQQDEFNIDEFQSTVYDGVSDKLQKFLPSVTNSNMSNQMNNMVESVGEYQNDSIYRYFCQCKFGRDDKDYFNIGNNLRDF